MRAFRYGSLNWSLAILAMTVLMTCAARAATVPATCANLGALFAKAQPGDRLEVAAGDCGDGDFYGRRTATVTIASADPLKPARFRSLSVLNASYLAFVGLRVDFTPTAATTTFNWATRIQDSDHVSFSNLRITGGPAISGLNEDGSGSDPGGTGNIIGRPTARGLLIQNAADVLVEGGELAGFFKGVLLNNASRVTIRGVDVHDMRTTAITGAQVPDLTVDGNWLHSAHPWRWGNGDHADLLALWSNPGQTTPNARVRIVNNRMEQLEGEAILGMWLQGSAAAPFTEFAITGNRIVVNNLQGVFVHDVRDGTIADNQMFRAGGGDPDQSPTVLLRENTTRVALTGNQVGAPISDLSGGVNPVSGTVLVLGDANIYRPAPIPAPAPPAPVPPVPPAPAPAPVPIPPPVPAPAPSPLPDIVVKLLPGQTVATSKPGKTYKPRAGQRAVFVSPN